VDTPVIQEKIERLLLTLIKIKGDMVAQFPSQHIYITARIDKGIVECREVVEALTPPRKPGRSENGRFLRTEYRKMVAPSIFSRVTHPPFEVEENSTDSISLPTP
jgi:hypothetical protein